MFVIRSLWKCHCGNCVYCMQRSAAQKYNPISNSYGISTIFLTAWKKASKITSTGKMLHFVEQPLNASHFMHVRKKNYSAFWCSPYSVLTVIEKFCALKEQICSWFMISIRLLQMVYVTYPTIFWRSGKSTINTKRMWIVLEMKSSKDDNIGICLNLDLKHFTSRLFPGKLYKSTFATNRKLVHNAFDFIRCHIFQCIVGAMRYIEFSTRRTRSQSTSCTNNSAWSQHSINNSSFDVRQTQRTHHSEYTSAERNQQQKICQFWFDILLTSTLMIQLLLFLLVSFADEMEMVATQQRWW